jgi:hypothetical protein
MSTIELENDNITDFHEKRRMFVIKAIVRANRMSREQVEKIIELHSFLTEVDYEIRNDLMDGKTLEKVESEIVFVREKFEDLFEMIKKELFIECNRGF